MINYTIINKYENVVGSADVTLSGNGIYSGKLQKSFMSERLVFLFKEYEECVNNQVLSFLDEIKDEIKGHGLSIKGTTLKLKDVEIFNEDDISFRIEI